MIERFDKAFSKVMERVALYWSGGIIWIMMIWVFSHVFARYVLRIGGILGTYAYVGALLVPCIYMALAYGWYKGSYVSIDILQSRIHGRTKWWFQLIFQIMMLIFFAGSLFVGAILETKFAIEITWLVGEPGYYMIGWPWRATMIVGTSLLIIRILLDIIHMIRTGEIIEKGAR